MSDNTNETATDSPRTDALDEDHRWDDADQPSLAVVDAVAAASDREPTDLPPIQETVDAGALDALAASVDGPATVSFTYADHDVVLDSGGTVQVWPAGD